MIRIGFRQARDYSGAPGVRPFPVPLFPDPGGGSRWPRSGGWCRYRRCRRDPPLSVRPAGSGERRVPTGRACRSPGPGDRGPRRAGHSGVWSACWPSRAFATPWRRSCRCHAATTRTHGPAVFGSLLEAVQQLALWQRRHLDLDVDAVARMGRRPTLVTRRHPGRSLRRRAPDRRRSRICTGSSLRPAGNQRETRPGARPARSVSVRFQGLAKDLQYPVVEPGSSSRNNTPLCASEISPVWACCRHPPARHLTRGMVRCRNGRWRQSQTSKRWSATEPDRCTVQRPSSERWRGCPAGDLASIDLPLPGGPIINRL